MSDVSGELPTKRQFSENVDSVFHVRVADAADFDLSLSKFEELISNEVQENFTLLFRAPLDAPQQQGVYRLEHEKLGAMEMFLVPVSKNADGLYYEAVFNLLVNP